LDHLVGGRQQRFRDGQAERRGGLHVDEEFDFRGLLDRQVGGLVALKNPAGIDAGKMIRVRSTARKINTTGCR
jgi:hypothetical protein